MYAERFLRQLASAPLVGFMIGACGPASLIILLWEVPGRSVAQQKEAGAPRSPSDEREVRRIRRILNAWDYGEHLGQLVSMGSAANAVYLSILADENATAAEVDRIFGLVTEQEGDRGEFLPHALRCLSHKNAAVRSTAAHLVGKIGGPDQAPSLVPLLSDEDVLVQQYAASALAKIGTAKELEALERRLAKTAEGDLPDILAIMRESRDRFKKRLDAAKKE